jgi:hypothetical protein
MFLLISMNFGSSKYFLDYLENLHDFFGKGKRSPGLWAESGVRPSWQIGFAAQLAHGPNESGQHCIGGARAPAANEVY